MKGTTKQVKYAKDLLALVEKEYKAFNIDSVDGDVDAIEKGFDKLLNIKDASTVIYYIKDVKNDRLGLYKTLAMIGGCKTISNIKLKGCA